MDLVEVSLNESDVISACDTVVCSVDDWGGVVDDSFCAKVGYLVVKLFNSAVDESNKVLVVDSVSVGI